MNEPTAAQVVEAAAASGYQISFAIYGHNGTRLDFGKQPLDEAMEYFVALLGLVIEVEL